jgi:hypothetical protein
MTTSRITKLSTQLASSIAGKDPQDVERLCRSFIEMAAKEAGSGLEARLKIATDALQMVHDRSFTQMRGYAAQKLAELAELS